jgi:hypothetical protein
MYYMNVQKERGSDSKNFGERITEFGVVVEKLWRFEVPGAFLQISWEKSKNWIFWNYFWTEKSVNSVHGLWTAGRLVHHWPADIAARRSSAFGRSSAWDLRPRGGGGEGRTGKLNGGVISGLEVVEGCLTGGIRFGNGGDGGGAQERGNERGRTPGQCEGGSVLGRVL